MKAGDAFVVKNDLVGHTFVVSSGPEPFTLTVPGQTTSGPIVLFRIGTYEYDDGAGLSGSIDVRV